MNKQKLAYKRLGDVSLFDNEETMDKLNSLGNPSEKLSKVIDFEMFRDFLGLASGDRVPDARTIWVFRKELTEKGLFDVLFDKFTQYLKANNLIMNEGIIIDGSFVEVPRQRSCFGA